MLPRDIKAAMLRAVLASHEYQQDINDFMQGYIMACVSAALTVRRARLTKTD